MSSFPHLKTGAVVQYPARRTLVFATRVLRFLDGSEQRFRDQVSALRRWQIRLSLLDEDELRAVAEFFQSMQGEAGYFSFEDPWDQTVYPRCSFESDNLTATLESEGRGSTELLIREERESPE